MRSSRCLVSAHGSATPRHKPARPPASQPLPGDEILGEWWTEDNEGRIRITRDKEGYYRGTTTCCAHPHSEGNPAIDVNNPKPELRKRSTIGIVLIWKLKYETGEYVDGYVYNPRDGKTYRMQMQVVDRETLKIRGYMGIPLLGQTQIWKRAHLEKSSSKNTSGGQQRCSRRAPSDVHIRKSL